MTCKEVEIHLGSENTPGWLVELRDTSEAIRQGSKEDENLLDFKKLADRKEILKGLHYEKAILVNG